MAKEMMEQTKNSILSQASQAMLAQANNCLKEFYNFFVNFRLFEGTLVLLGSLFL